MRARIQKSMLLVLCITLLTTFSLLIAATYVHSLNNMKDELKQEAVYIQTAIDISGTKYLEDMDAAQVKTRLTMIDDKGNVLYDSKEDEFTFENHKERKEVRDAFLYGYGEDLRKSNTLGEQTYYYALMLKDGNVLRVAKTVDNVRPAIMEMLPYMAAIAVGMFAFAYFLAKWQTSRLIRPINNLNLEAPLENDVYEELKPLLLSIDKQNKEKEAIANMRKEFTANVSHELKTPLTSISGYAEIMKSGLVKAEDMKGFSERIYNEASRLITLVEDIIKLSKLDEGRVEMEREEVDLFGLAREICSRLSPQSEKKKVHLSVTGEEVVYRGVRRILDEMIYNICENAIKYNVSGGEVKIWVGNTLKGPKIVVQDTGIGIPEDQKERIFERFYRVDKSHSKETGGTGLGLSIVKHGAILHNAKITVDSEVGEGTRMEILFERDK